MATGKPSDAQLCGQLYAALAALQKLSAAGNNHSLSRPGARAQAADKPHRHMYEHVQKMGQYFLDARARGRSEPATAILRSIPDLLPAKVLPDGLTPAQREEFCEGYQAQSGSLRKAHPTLG